MIVPMAAALAWLRQPSTVTGLSALAAAAAGVASGQMNLLSAIPVMVFGAVAIALPDNSAAPGDARRLALDGVAMAQGKAGPAAGVVIQDAAALAADLRPAAPPASR